MNSNTQVFFDEPATLRTFLRSPPSIYFGKEFPTLPAHILNDGSELSKSSVKHMLPKHPFGTDAVIQVFHENHITNITKEQTYSEGSEVKKGNSGLAYGIGYGSGFLIYITLLIYGNMVMRGVTEEKTNRIAEVVISSVKPFQLMIGKIVGIGAVGLTQFLIWIILIVVLSTAATAFLPPKQFSKCRSRTSKCREQQPSLRLRRQILMKSKTH
jgi:hypothetical protein